MTRQTKTITVVQCALYGEELPALDRPPFPGPLGQRIFAWNIGIAERTPNFLAS